MREFFKGWRRKVGVCTLLLACTFATGWIRSLAWSDGISIPCGTRDEITFVSSDQMLLIWLAKFDVPLDSFLPHVTINPGAHPVSHFMNLENVPLEWSFKIQAFQLGKSEYLPKYKRAFLFAVAPYGAIVIPLTLITTWLLICKHSSSQSNQSVEPGREAVA